MEQIVQQIPRPPSRAEAHADVRRMVQGSQTSFGWGMRMLPRVRREAMHALYAFCRQVDDIADGVEAPERKRARLCGWQQEIDRLYAGRPGQTVTVALAEAVERFDLPQSEFHRILEGMELDADGRMLAPSSDLLMHYCRCVAGSVGLLSVRIFGAGGADAQSFALALGDALQLTNILRDIDEDAARGRLYLPAELLGRRCADHDLAAGGLLDDPSLPQACRSLAETAQARYDAAERALARCDRGALRPAVMMMGVYRYLFDRLVLRGWEAPRPPVTLSRPRRLVIALRHALPGPSWPRRMS